MLVTAVFFFALLAGSVTIQAQRIQTQHRLDTVNAGLEAGLELNQQLRADVATAESPDRILTEATALGLVESATVEPLVSGTAGTGEPTVDAGASVP